jgi:hypothetical protein
MSFKDEAKDVIKDIADKVGETVEDAANTAGQIIDNITGETHDVDSEYEGGYPSEMGSKLAGGGQRITTDDYTNKEYSERLKQPISELDEFENSRVNHEFEPHVGGIAYAFFVAPELFIYPDKVSDEEGYYVQKVAALSNMRVDPVFSQYTYRNAPSPRDKRLAQYLSFYNYEDLGNFIPLLTNRMKNFETKDVALDTMEIYKTREGYNMTIPYSLVPSSSSDNININFQETQNADVTKLITMWVNYIYNVSRGNFIANPEMINTKTFDYFGSIYYFVLKPDGKTISYYAKYSGVAPTGIPFSSFGMQKGERNLTEVSVNFVYSFKEDMNPRILEDFNKTMFNHDVDPEFIPDYKDALQSSSYFDDFTELTILSPEVLDATIESWKLIKFPHVYIDRNTNTDGTTHNSYKLDFPNINDYEVYRQLNKYTDGESKRYYTTQKDNLSRYLKDIEERRR